jgi:glycosyltransferase involved in cell wall biosynthesis
VGRPRLPATLVYWNLLSRRIGREVAQLEPDIVHVHGAAGLAFAWPELASPLVMTPHGMAHRDIMMGRPGWLRNLTAPARAMIVKRVERKARKRASEVILVNDYVLEELPDLCEHSSHNIPNPVSDIYLRGNPVQRSVDCKPELLQIGGVWPRKNTLKAIELVGALTTIGRPASLHIIGPIVDRAYLEACRGAVMQLGLAGNVHFHGEQTPSEIVEQLDRADLLVVTSRAEVAPMVVAEAFCRGVPVAAPRAFGLRYMIKEGVDGVFLDSANDVENACNMAAFLDKCPDRARIAQEARQNYAVDAIVQRTIDVYHRALAQDQ